jgi:NDP-sugar pyrophosphorylase family protein
MIMAAGKGTRLRPLTDLIPKPMAPIVNRPALLHILRLLNRHGFRDVVINLHHLPDAIQGYFGDGAALGMNIRYSFEKDLLGTAGGVKNNEGFLKGDTFLVMSGDALTDIDLSGLVSRHRRVGSIATLALKEVADPSLYGVVVLDDDDRVVGFQEKPPIEEAKSRLCNCGIYVFESEILDHIPTDQFDDFGSRVFPDLIRQKIPFHGAPIEGYWSDVGNLIEYVRGNRDALAGRVQVEVPGTEIRPGVWVEECVTFPAGGPESSRLEPPIVIGRGCVIEEGVTVEGPSVIGDGCLLRAGSHVFRGLVLPGSEVPKGSVVVEGVVGRRPDGGGAA